MRYILLLLLLSGCATATQTATPSGKQGYSIDCSGTALSWNLCYSKAGQVCPGGYKVIAQNSDSGLLAGPYAVTTTVSRTLLVQCN